jgi:hypothetical protein
MNKRRMRAKFIFNPGLGAAGESPVQPILGVNHEQ